MEDSKNVKLLTTFELVESQRTDCFLCHPAEQLVCHVGENLYTMAGLGPLVDGYAIIAAKMHSSDNGEDDPLLFESLAQYSESVQSILAAEFGTCILTEHGKMPLCIPCDQAGSHCFHKHFLLFPGAPDPQAEFCDYLDSEGKRFESLLEALRFAAELPSYLLVSSRAGEYYVFTSQHLPQQFARGIIADLLNQPGLASWRAYPNGTLALQNAVFLRQLLADKFGRYNHEEPQ